MHSLSCALQGGCDERDSLDLAYGADVAALVRRYSPNISYERDSAALPVDFRRCRKTDCSDGPDAATEISRSSAGQPVTSFTRVVDRRSGGGPLYLQYWFYYPESFTGGIGRLFGDSWPGYHPDDWEGYQVRVAPGGRVRARHGARRVQLRLERLDRLVSRVGRQPRRRARKERATASARRRRRRWR